MDRAQLQQIKLRALARDHFGADASAEAHVFRDGAALLDGPRAFVLTDDQLGAAASWALKRDATELTVLTDSGAVPLARSARLLALPTTVWQVSGRDVALTEGAAPSVPVTPPSRWSALIPAADADPVAEDGTWHAEVLGLEVAAVADGDVLRIGLNESDRQAHEELLHDTQPLDALTKVVEQVRAVRRAGSDHPLCLRDRDRWLRRAVVDDSSLAGVDGALTIGPWRATATGDDVVVACGAGVDLELPLRAAAAAAALGASRVVVAVPRVDALPALERLAGALGVTCEVVPVDRVPWLA